MAGQYWLFIDLAPEFGGHEMMVIRWIEELHQLGSVRAVVVCHRNSRLSRLLSSICTVIEVDADGHASGKVDALKQLWEVATAVRRVKRRFRPTLAVAAEGSIMAQRYGVFAAKLARLYTVLYVPMVGRFEEMRFPHSAQLEKKVKAYYGRLPNAWLTITPEQGLQLRAWAGVTRPIHALPNTVARRFETAPRGSRGESTSSDDRLRVLVLGRLDAIHKGLDLLLDFLQTSPKIAHEFCVHFAGEGPFADELDKAIQSSNFLSKFVTRSGWIDSLKALADTDVLLMPSRFEGVPLVMLEAMALGVPVVASDLPGTRAHLPTECLFKIEDIGAAFRILSTLRANPAMRAQIADTNLETFRARCSWRAFSQAVEELSKDLSAASSGVQIDESVE